MTPLHLLIIIVILIIARIIIHNKKDLNWSEKKRKTVNENLDSVVIAGITALLLITFIVRTFYIPSSSMVPTLKIGDFILVNKFVYRFYQPARHDVIVFSPPPSAQAEGKEFIKRIVAVGGDTVEVKDNKLFINDIPQEEPFINESPNYIMPKVSVPQASLFVMGDNRNNSDDSHVWGFLPKENIEGKAVLIFFPFTRLKTM